MQKQSNSKKNILNRIAGVSTRTSAIGSFERSTNQIYKAIEPDHLSCFVNELAAVNGKVVICETNDEMYAKLADLISTVPPKQVHCQEPAILEALSNMSIDLGHATAEYEMMQMGITTCECLVARTGSVLVTSRLAAGRKLNVFPPIHVVIANQSQLVGFLDDAIAKVSEKYDNNIPSTISFITGPSRTADIEKTLVLGAHGPKELIVFISKE
jgi:L-lactate dehydrogenase complex protein LldG